MIIKDSNLDVDNDVVISTAQHLFTDKNPEAFLDAYAKLDDTQKFFTLLTVLDASDDITKPIFKKTLANLSSDLIDIKTWNKVGANKDNQLKIFSMVTEIGNSEFLIFVIYISMETNWKVLITSRANDNGLSLEQIETVFNSYKDPENVEFKDEHRKSVMAAYGQYPTAVWQLEKSEEMDNLFYDNMTFSISDGVVSFSTEYEVELTDFGRSDVVEWSEGLNKIRIAYSSAGIVKLDDPFRAPSRKMLDDLVKNQTIHVSKL